MSDYTRNIRRRVRRLQKAHKLPPISERRMQRMLAQLERVRGDGLTDADLRVILKLTLRGLFD